MDNPAFDEDQADLGTDAASSGDTGPQPGADSGDPDGSDSGPVDDTGSDDPLGPPPGAVAMSATFSACRGGEASPTECAMAAGEGVFDAIVIDQASDSGDFLVACMTFEVAEGIADKTINAVLLELHTIDASNSSSDAAGEIWAVEPFTEADFAVGLPPRIGVSPLAPNPGPGKIFKPVYWHLPVDVVSGNAQVYLCAYPLSGDGAYFYSHAGPFPPVLYVDFE
ncbi:hypothetical protein DB30_04912 [Enhygromyxa salina]|uniref:Uncharacterized protein n=1 Tax=Enhygromyxa salina TaxID=215803 RepID=A0A0C2D2P6_9BACT|nr:hypothetical protein [Enhygromyxa salina]KIG16040.1 hypothetical protein DB30_04912 [Enhygromyxa salina]